MHKNTKAHEAAHEIAGVNSDGEAITMKATISGTENMIVIIPQLKTQEGKIKVLKDNALYMGIGAQFMQTVIPKAVAMQGELEDRGSNKNEAQLLTAIWLGSIIKDIHDQLSDIEE